MLGSPAGKMFDFSRGVKSRRFIAGVAEMNVWRRKAGAEPLPGSKGQRPCYFSLTTTTLSAGMRATILPFSREASPVMMLITSPMTPTDAAPLPAVEGEM